MGERERKWIREKERALSLLLPLLYKNLDIIIVSLSHTYSYEICHLSEDKIPLPSANAARAQNRVDSLASLCF
jgi:hypothetical protein